MAKKKKTTLKQSTPKASPVRPVLFKFPDWSWKAMLLVLAVLGGLVFFDFLTLSKALLFKDVTGGDSMLVYYPKLILLADSWREAGMPLWSFQTGMGHNIYPDGINNLFIWPLLVLGRDLLAYGIAYMEFFKVILAGMFFYFYVRTVGWGKYVAFIGGILMAFSGYLILGTGWFSSSKYIVFFVLMLFSFELYFREKKWWLFPLALLFLNGPSLYFAGIFMVLYAAFRFTGEFGFQWKKGIRFAASLMLLGIVSLLLMAPFLLPNMDSLLGSPRMSGGWAFDNHYSSYPMFKAASVQQTATVVMRFFSNDLLGISSDFKGYKNYLEAPAFYCGLLTLLLVPQVFFFINKRQKWIYGGLLALWALILLFPYFRYALYNFKGDYFKYALSSYIPLTMLFFGLHALYFLCNNNRVKAPALLITLAILLGLLFFPYMDNMHEMVDKSLQTFVAAMLSVYSLLLLGWNNAKAQPWVKILLPIFICFEVFWMANLTVNKRDVVTSKELKQRIGYNDYTLEAIDYLKKTDKSFYRVNKYFHSSLSVVVSLNDAQAQGFYGSPCYSSFNQNNYVKFLQEVGEASATEERSTRYVQGLVRSFILQGWASSKYSLNREGDERHFDERYHTLLTTLNGIEIFANKAYLPLGFTYDQYQTLDDFRKRKSPSYDHQHLSLLYAAVIGPELQPKLKGLREWGGNDVPDALTYNAIDQAISTRQGAPALAVTHHSQTRIEGAIQVEKPRLLFFSIPYDKGWSATVDGEKAELLQVNVGFMGILLPEGKHLVGLRYSPRFFYEGWAVFLVGLALYVYLLLKWKRKQGQGATGGWPVANFF